MSYHINDGVKIIFANTEQRTVIIEKYYTFQECDSVKLSKFGMEVTKLPSNVIGEITYINTIDSIIVIEWYEAKIPSHFSKSQECLCRINK